jgi:hypothetical protein
MDYIKLTGNNGSVPDPYYQHFSLTFFDDGISVLEIKNGRPPEDRIMYQDRQQKSSKEITALITEAQQFATKSNDLAMVGGPEKFIEINCNGNALMVLTVIENTEEFKFYFKCIDSFNPGLRKRLADIL